MEHRLERTELLFGSEGMARLKSSHVAVFGLGGVGSYAVEGLARSGIGTLTLVDRDVYSISNMNRQLYASVDTIGQRKTDAAAERVSRIAPDCRVVRRELFYLPETADQIDLSEFDCIVDAIDTMSAKIELICRAKAAGVPVISSMGTGNKLDPTQLKVADLYQTKGCPVARILRRELKKRGISSLPVVFSEEPSMKTVVSDAESGRHAPGSAVFVPGCAGLILAREAVRILLTEYSG